MKKTAVEWMVEKLFRPMDNPPIENVSDIIKQAKEMQKQQIIDAYRKGKIQQLENSELYYTETYEK